MTERPDERVDELRRQLRSLGYLDAGVDRFLLAPARDTRGPAALAARSSVRVGLLGGVLLGPAAAIGLGARVPGLVSGVRDAAVLAVYLGVLFFLAVTAASLLISLAASALVRARDERFARSARIVSRDAGRIIAVACLIYLTFWWRNANAGFGWSAPVWTAFALAVAVGISWLLGHAVRITTLAVLAAGRGAEAQLPPVTTTSWRLVAGGGALAFAGAAALLVLTAADAPSAADHPPLTVVSPGVSVRLIAIDGFDPAIYEAMEQAAPSRAGLFGTRFRIEPQDTSDPARAWTTIATGTTPEVHGVHAIETTRLAGVQGILSSGSGTLGRTIRAATDVARLTRPSIASRDERRAKTVWEVAEEAGLRTAVVNWWATWPAPPGAGIVLTDRAVLRLEHGGALDAEIAPASLYPVLQGAWPAIRKEAQDAAASAFADVTDPVALATLRRSAELDLTILGIARALPGPPRDLEVLYLPGLDIAQHALLTGDQGVAQAPSAVAGRVDALKGYYQFLAVALERVIAPGPKQMVFVVTSPGRVQSTGAGILSVAQGGALLESATSAAARVVDVAPTVLYALGVPLSRELAGQPLRDLFGGAAQSPSAVAGRVDALKGYYHFLAVALERVIAPGPRQMVFVVTSAGRVQNTGAGILSVAQGGALLESATSAAARVVDVAPTVLYALGVPLSRELAGQPLRDLFGGAALNEHRERYVSTYGRPFSRPAAREGKPLDQEMIDRLRSLGYVK